MKALVKAEPAEGLVMRDEPIPKIGPDDVLIKVAKTGICGTDLHIWKWDEWAQKTIPVPMVVGHEFSGVVAEVGTHVRTVKPGDRVSGEGHLIGMKSRMARAGHFHLDPETRGVGVNVPGAFAEYLRIPAFNAIHLPPEVDDEIGAILDPLGNAVHTTLSFDLVGEDVLITGAGPIGCMAIPIAKQAGARHVVITDINPYRLDLARKMGATRALNVKETKLADAMHELGMKEGFDVALEMSGHPSAFADILPNMFYGGKIALLGIMPTNAAIDWNLVVFHSLTLKGIYGREMFETWYKMTALIQSGLDISPVITHRFPFTQFKEAIELA